MDQSDKPERTLVLAIESCEGAKKATFGRAVYAYYRYGAYNYWPAKPLVYRQESDWLLFVR